ncbi:hypothetical protein BCV70DRAFT_223724 [Testicularia cyperi]|uniref:Bet v1-like protein n=1 Tax=Testicularia cyperi TaxID=1882483 RepID=A0A317XPS0_9BASI|nr:hypothetical protein BCV70DRAFT_223724 [Testicularia cyperi]
MRMGSMVGRAEHGCLILGLILILCMLPICFCAPLQIEESLYDELATIFYKDVHKYPQKLDFLKPMVDYQPGGPFWADHIAVPHPYNRKRLLVLKVEESSSGRTVYAVDRKEVERYRPSRLPGGKEVANHVYRIWRMTKGDTTADLELAALARVDAQAHGFWTAYKQGYEGALSRAEIYTKYLDRPLPTGASSSGQNAAAVQRVDSPPAVPPPQTPSPPPVLGQLKRVEAPRRQPVYHQFLEERPQEKPVLLDLFH